MEGANTGPGVLGDLHKGEDPPRVPQRPRMPGGSKLNRGGMSAKESDEWSGQKKIFELRIFRTIRDKGGNPIPGTIIGS